MKVQKKQAKERKQRDSRPHKIHREKDKGKENRIHCYRRNSSLLRKKTMWCDWSSCVDDLLDRELMKTICSSLGD